MADKSFGSLGKRLQKRAEQLVESVERATKVGALAGLRAATQATPVRTGNARFNWNVSLKTPTVSVTQLSGSISEAEASKRAISRSNPKIRRFKIKDGTIWITNGVRYIRGLDTGGLSQRGGQMSAKAALAAQRAIRRSLATRGIFKKGP